MKRLLIVCWLMLTVDVGYGQIGWHLKQAMAEPTFSYSILNSRGYIQSVHELIQLPWSSAYKLTQVRTYTMDSICHQLETLVPMSDLDDLRDFLNQIAQRCIITADIELWVHKNEFYAIINRRDGDCYYSFIVTEFVRK